MCCVPMSPTAAGPVEQEVPPPDAPGPASCSELFRCHLSLAIMDEFRQRVHLTGGSFNGQQGIAHLPPSVLRIAVRDGESTWTELYFYAEGATHVVDGEGSLPVMRFMARTDENA